MGQFQNRQTQRARWHDYRSRCIYMITLTLRKGAPHLARLVSSPVPHSESTAFGDVLDSAFSDVFCSWPLTSIIERCLMPDHAHYIIFVKERLPKPLGSYIGRVKGAATSEWRKMTNIPDAAFFEPDYNDRIVFQVGRLQTLIDYVRDNPRRAIIKRESPELFAVNRNINIGGESFDACGNIYLLFESHYEPVAVHRAWSVDELMRATDRWRSCARDGGVLVSPFISTEEKKILNEAAELGGRAILLINSPMGERYKPNGRYFDLCSSGRLLILQPAAIAGGAKITRSEALRLNATAERLCRLLNR